MNFIHSVAAKIVFAGLVVALPVALWARGEHYARRARTSEGLLASAITVANANAEITRLHENIAVRIDAVQSLNEIRKRDIRRASDMRRKVIINALPETDGPLAPVLRDQLDRLPEPARSDPNRFVAAAQGADVSSTGE